MASSKMLVVQVAALGMEFLEQNGGRRCAGMDFASLSPAFPELTCVAQASFRTASSPRAHGMVANGFYDRTLRRPFFWEQSSRLIDGERIWGAARAAGKTVGMLFWQQSLGEQVDYVLSPAPIHRHHGGMIQDCYSQPAGLYATVRAEVGRPFDLKHYWGPCASWKASQWIAEATRAVISDDAVAPDLCLTYLPALDYDLQRFGPTSPQSRAAFDRVREQLEMLVDAAGRHGYEVVVFGDYAIGSCSQAVYPNRCLRQAGLFSCRKVERMLYPDYHTSRAFAMVDHEIAHIYVDKPGDIDAVHSCLDGVEGIEKVLSGDALASAGVAHARSGDVLVVAGEGWWFAYPWWDTPAEEPDYARHVDIHNKPGYDPCELFFGWPPLSVSRDAGRIGGTHGAARKARPACWASTCLDAPIESLTDLAHGVQNFMEG